VVLPPVQINALPVAVTLPSEPTLTTAVCIAVQPPSVPVTVYVVVEAGDAETEAPFVALRPVDGAHV
jgi:hypothetical protein